jgi:hypothetical protein
MLAAVGGGLPPTLTRDGQVVQSACTGCGAIR